MFDLKQSGNRNIYLEIARPLTPVNWNDARIALITSGNDKLKRPCIRIYNWTDHGKVGRGSVYIPMDAIPALKQAIDFLMIKGANSIK